MAKRALITGIFGFTGRALAGALVEGGMEVHGLGRARDETSRQSLPATIHTADLGRPDEIRAAIAEARPDYIVHLAGIAHVAHGNLDEMYLSNIVGTRNLLDEAVSALRPIEQVIVASSAIVYGNQDVAVLTEDAPILPVNDYGVSKASVELVAAMYSDRVPVTVVRPFNYTGVGQSPNFLIPKIVDHFRDRAEAIELGNVDVARDFSDVRDVCEIYGRLLGNQAALGRTFNICSGRAVALREVLDTCSRVSGHRLDIRVNPAFVRANEVKTLAGSTERLTDAIGPMPRIALEDTLRWMLEAS